MGAPRQRNGTRDELSSGLHIVPGRPHTSNASAPFRSTEGELTGCKISVDIAVRGDQTGQPVRIELFWIDPVIVNLHVAVSM
jgi:hypothetical protein